MSYANAVECHLNFHSSDVWRCFWVKKRNIFWRFRLCRVSLTCLLSVPGSICSCCHDQVLQNQSKASLLDNIQYIWGSCFAVCCPYFAGYLILWSEAHCPLGKYSYKCCSSIKVKWIMSPEDKNTDMVCSRMTSRPKLCFNGKMKLFELIQQITTQSYENELIILM